MERTSNQSEIAQLIGRIESEVNAMHLAMDGFASVARHDIINHRFENLGVCFEELAGQIGEQAAIETIIATLEQKT
jgi:hypothetical protein